MRLPALITSLGCHHPTHPVYAGATADVLSDDAPGIGDQKKSQWHLCLTLKNALQHHFNPFASACAQERLLMCYAATHPEKMDDQKKSQWQKLARLREEDMEAIVNLEYLGVPVRKRGRSAGGLVFGRKRKRAVRKVNPCPLCVGVCQFAGCLLLCLAEVRHAHEHCM
jgi:hypothetical protein